MDKNLVRERFSKAVGTYDDNALVQKEICSKLTAGLLEVLPQPPAGRTGVGRVLEVGCGTGLLTRKFLQYFSPEKLWLNDLCPEVQMPLADVLSDGAEFIEGDAEQVPWPQELDMIISSSSVQWFDDLPAFFQKCADSLAEGAILAFSAFGERNVAELKALEGLSLNYHSLEEFRTMLEGSFQVLSAREEVNVMEFSSATEVLRHLKNTGVTGIRKEAWTRGRVESFCRRYEAEFSPVTLTYHPVLFICRKA